MVTFTEENIDWITKLIEESIGRASSEEKKIKLEHLKNKVSALGELKFTVNVTEKDLKGISEVLSDLEKLTLSYSNLHDISALEDYDKLKKQFASKLEYLSTYKDILLDEVNHLDDVLKKELRIKLVLNIKDEEGVSYSQADKMVDMDKRYTVPRDQINHIERVANKVKTKYDFYMKLWQMIFQNVSTASKEKYASANNND